MAPVRITLLLLLLQASRAAATSDPDPITGWVWGIGSTRSTCDIVWSCISIIIVCTFRVVHLNLPSASETSGKLWNRSYWIKPIRKIKWMFIMALSPEIVLSICISDWLWAKDSVAKFKRLYDGTKSVDTLDLDALEKMEGKVTQEVQDIVEDPFEWTKVQAHYANMGGYILKFECPAMLLNPTCDSIPLFANQVFELVREFGLQLPQISSDEIRDRSKADFFAKLFAIGQSSWLIVQCIARTYQGMAFSQLELATIAFVVCAVVEYLLWWDKPFDVDQPVAITCPRRNSNLVAERMKEMFAERYKSRFLSFEWEDLLRMKRIPNWAYMEDIGLGRRVWLLSILFIMGFGAIFSGIHVVAWNWEFPTPWEQTLWRIMTLSSTIICVQCAIILPFMGTGSKKWQRWVVIIWVIPAWGLYMVMRVVIICQIFLSLRRMPESVYDTVNWVEFIPHFR